MIEADSSLQSMRPSDDTNNDSCKDVSDCRSCSKPALQPGSAMPAAADSAKAHDVYDARAQETSAAGAAGAPSSNCLPEVVQASLRRRYSKEFMLQLRSSFTSEPVGWRAVKADGEKLACHRDYQYPEATSDLDWPVIMEGWKNKKPVSLAYPRSPCKSPSKVAKKSPIGPNRHLSPSKSPSKRLLPGYNPFGDHPLSSLTMMSASRDTHRDCQLPLLVSSLTIRTTRGPAAAPAPQPVPPARSWASCSTPGSAYGSNTSTPTAVAAAVPFWNDQDSLVLVKELIAQLSEPDPEVVAQAASHLAHLCATSIEDQHIVRHEQGIPVLTKLLQSKTAAVQESAAAAIWSLGRGNNENQAVLVCSGVMPRLVRLLGSSSSALQYIASSALLALIKDQRRMQDPAADSGAIQMLAHVLKTGSILGKCAAAETLEAIIIDSPRNQTELLKTDVLDLLVNLLKFSDNDSPNAMRLQAAAVGVLLALMSLNKHHGAVADAGARPVLQKLLMISQGSEHAWFLQCQVMTALKKLDADGHSVGSPYKHIPTPHIKLRPMGSPLCRV